ncbi:MAG: S1C family serine protease [Defluviitaleaceae bacterium]|nr:S1C family serine protease [Defluviitaleaceae bacterium]
MNENNIFNDMNEIERIQADIARDLEIADALELSVPPVLSSALMPPSAAYGAQPVMMPHFAPRPVVVPQARGSWLRKLALVCIVCTLGTASFGFAAGAAGEWMRGRGVEDVGAPVVQEVPADAGAAPSYVFEQLQDPSFVATIADMIDLIVPGVVSLTTFTDAEEDGFQRMPARRNGSGVIFAEGEDQIYIATSHYVVQLGTHVQVRFACGALVFAQPFAQDQDINISVITVGRAAMADAGVADIALATFGDSSEMRMGDTVIALGNARGEGISATRGVISTEEHVITVWGRNLGRYIDIYTLQTDASINYGDSGGPLLNARGEVIGIIDASIMIFDMGAQAEGIGHSIASNTVQPALYEIVNRMRPAIGIQGGDVPAMLAEALGIPQMGALVSHVTQNGAAQRAGVQPGDIITGFNELPVLDFNQMRMEVATLRPGDTVEMRILRDGEVLVLEVTLLPMQFDRF